MIKLRSLFVITLLAANAVSQQKTDPLAISKNALTLLVNERYGELHSMFTGKLAGELTEDDLRQRVGPAIKAMGNLQTITEPKVLRTPKGTDVIFQLKSPRNLLGVLMSIDPAGRVAGLNIRTQEIPGVIWTSPPYARPDSFEARSVTIGGGQWKLPGTLLVPKGKGPFPAVVMAHGSPPYDRDEGIEANKPFRDIAEGLASRGIAVLRFENRSRAYASRMAGIRGLTIQQEIVDDVVFAGALLRSQLEVDGKRIFVLGHNAAAHIAPRIAQADPQIAGLILLAANVTPLHELVVLQAENANVPAAQLKQIREEVAKVNALRLPSVNSGQILGEPASYWLDLKDYNPATVAKGLSCRLLLVQGGRDFQVMPKELVTWRSILAGKRNATFREYPALNHLFIAGEGKSSLAEYKKPGHVAAEVISDIATWVTKP
jgi:dienelactone hydrolase